MMGNANSNTQRNFTRPQLSDEQFLNQLSAQTGIGSNPMKRNLNALLSERELGNLSNVGLSTKRRNIVKSGFNQKEKVYLGHRYVPNTLSNKMFKYAFRIFCGQFSNDGTIFMSATQDRRIRFYNTSDASWQKIKEVVAADVGWSIIDTDYSPDKRWLIYSGWSDNVNLCNITGEYEIHDSLQINKQDTYHFCLFSIKFSPDSNEILGGSNDSSLYIYDLNRRELTLKIAAHNDDINSVSYAEADNNNTIISGSDDCLCKIWDRRLLGNGTQQKAVGIFVGHNQGITHVSSKGDGRYFISNSKDQSIKLWDLRVMRDTEQEKTFAKATYDYRFGLNEGVYRTMTSYKKDPNDCSLMTYKGSHSVTKTLIRAYLSPLETTGQKYIYSGSSDGSVVIYDVLTGELVETLEGHASVVRDVSWHPHLPYIVSTSWDGCVNRWDYYEKDDDEKQSTTNNNNASPLYEESPTSQEDDEENVDPEEQSETIQVPDLASLIQLASSGSFFAQYLQDQFRQSENEESEED